MVRKKVAKKNTRKSAQKPQQSFFSKVKFNDSYISMFLGALVVVILAAVGFSLLKVNKPQNTGKQVSSTSTVLSVPSVISEAPGELTSPPVTATPGEAVVSDKNNQALPEKYTVMPGENLWTISEKVYGSGYNWVDIAKANNISNPGVIFSGNQLKIPNVEPKTLETELAPQVITTQAEGAIFGNSYTVVKGDNLWDIAVRAYGDGYKWVDIAKENNLTNPSLIFSDNVFKLPR